MIEGMPGHGSWGLRGSWPPEICRRGQSMFQPSKMSRSFIETVVG